MERIVKLKVLFVATTLVLAASISSALHSSAESQELLTPKCQEVNCIEKIDHANYAIGSELIIKFCADSFNKTHEYRWTEMGWMLMKIDAKGTSKCPG